jgi:hypothetical protein
MNVLLMQYRYFCKLQYSIAQLSMTYARSISSSMYFSRNDLKDESVVRLHLERGRKKHRSSCSC